jgi:hypothetical protein
MLLDRLVKMPEVLGQGVTAAAASRNRHGQARLWGLWATGALLFPVTALIVPAERLPLPRITDWRVGIVVWAAWALGFAFMSVAMWRARSVGIRTLVVAQILAGVAFAFTPAMPSIDAYMYLGFGDMLTHGENPWKPPVVPPRDPVAIAATTAWGNPPVSSRYGPLFIAGEGLVTRALAGASVWQLLIVQRLLSLIAAVGVTLLIRGPNIRFWALSPFVAYFYVLEAHNDVLFLVLLSAAARFRQPVVAGLTIGMASMIKIIALAALGLRRVRSAISASAGALVAIICSMLAVPHAFTFSALLGQAREFGNSPIALLRSGLLAIHTPHAVAAPLATVSVVGTIAVASVCIRWSRRDAPAVLALLFILTLPRIWPWYFGWALLPAIATGHRKTLLAVVSLSACAFVFELPQFGMPLLIPAVTLLYLVLGVVIARRSSWYKGMFRIPRTLPSRATVLRVLRS